MKRILHVIDQGDRGGAERVFVDLTLGLSAAGWAIIPVLPADGWTADELRAGGVEPTFAAISGRALDHGYLRTLFRLIGRHGADVVHVHLLGPAVYGSLAALARRVPAVATFHGQVDLSERERFRGLKFAAINRAACATVFVSDHLRQFYLTHTPLRRERAVVIHNGVAFEPPAGPPGGASRSSALRRELGIGADEVLVGAIGNVRPAKAYDDLLRAAALLRAQSSRYRFVIAGLLNSALAADLAALRDRLGLADAVTFAGYRPDVAEVLASLDLYVLTSESEGFSLAVVEAMAAGVPVVATRCGGPEEIIVDGETGVLVPRRDPRAIADALGRLWNDTATRQRLSLRAMVDVRERFGMTRMLDSYAALYDRCGSHAGGRA